jgi:hypothetical protein
MRWVAAIGWAATPAALLFSRFVSIPFASVVDVAPIAIPLGVAITIAAGGRIGRIGAGIGAGLAAIVTLLILWIIMAGCLFRCGENSWLAPAGTAALAGISLLAARKMRSTPRG